MRSFSLLATKKGVRFLQPGFQPTTYLQCNECVIIFNESLTIPNNCIKLNTILTFSTTVLQQPAPFAALDPADQIFLPCPKGQPMGETEITFPFAVQKWHLPNTKATNNAVVVPTHPVKRKFIFIDLRSTTHYPAQSNKKAKPFYLPLAQWKTPWR